MNRPALVLRPGTPLRNVWAGVLALGLLALAPPTRADLDLKAALRALPMKTQALPRALEHRSKAALPLIVERTEGRTLPSSVLPINDEFYAFYASGEELRALASSATSARVFWSPPRRLLLDRADGWTRASAMRMQANVTGRGVVVGVLDTGVDVLHPDLRNGDGSTRVRWLIDFTRGPLGRNPELEQEYGCLERSSPCAVYSDADIDELITNRLTGDEPRDTFGHGTHVASLAAGNGRSNPELIGVAPEADLIVARVTESGGGDLTDADILRGTRFVFERARASGAPAVLNLSLGSDFGAHDGNSALERALASFVGPDEPGRAIVVAAGNSAGLYASDELGAQGPFGVHTMLHVPRGSPAARVPVLMVPQGVRETLFASVFIWISFRKGDELSLGLELDDEPWIEGVAKGQAVEKSRAELSAVVANGVSSADDPTLGARVRPENDSAVVLLTGSWPAKTRFQLRFAGHGTASLWVQGSGALDPTLSVGAVFPFATKEGTINIPASAPELIAVGATLNRVDWKDALENRVVQAENGAERDSPADSTAFFSSAGPNALGMLKPDIVAPGMNVIGAMSRLADPRRGATSLFANAGRCGDARECFVVDDAHAVSSGTSMAAPLVAGAVALLFERNPELTQEEVRALLRAGARPLRGTVFVEQQAGPGALDLEATLSAESGSATARAELPSAKSTIVLAASYAHPDPEWPLEGQLELRADSGAIADGFDPRRLAVVAEGGVLREAPTRIAPGLYRFTVASAAGTGGGTLNLRLTFDGATLTERSVPIAVDLGAKTGMVTARGGCAIRAGAPHESPTGQAPGSGTGPLAPLALLSALALFARLHQRRTR